MLYALAYSLAWLSEGLSLSDWRLSARNHYSAKLFVHAYTVYTGITTRLLTANLRANLHMANQ